MATSPFSSLICFEANSSVFSKLVKNEVYPALPGFATRSDGCDSSSIEREGGITFVAATEIDIVVDGSSPSLSTTKAKLIRVERIRVEEERVELFEMEVEARPDDIEVSSRMRSIVESISSRDAERISLAKSQKTFGVRPFDHAS